MRSLSGFSIALVLCATAYAFWAPGSNGASDAVPVGKVGSWPSVIEMHSGQAIKDLPSQSFQAY